MLVCECVCMSMYIKYTGLTIVGGCITQEDSNAVDRGFPSQIQLGISCTKHERPLGLTL